MKSVLIAAAAVVGLSGAAWAGGPTLMTDDQMDKVVAGVVPHEDYLQLDGTAAAGTPGSGFYADGQAVGVDLPPVGPGGGQGRPISGGPNAYFCDLAGCD